MIPRIIFCQLLLTCFGFAGAILPSPDDEAIKAEKEKTESGISLRIVAANLTSGSYQSYSADNGNHSNPEGAGARILKALQPDLILIQEFNTGGSPRQWVNSVFGSQFHFMREGISNAGPNSIPNGIISRYPIVASGEWKDKFVPNRDFVWAKIALPDKRFLWAISVHLYAQSAGVRAGEMEQLMAEIKRSIPPEDFLVVGGDFNTRNLDEPCLKILKPTLVMPKNLPADLQGNINTNAGRKRPYDWILVNQSLQAAEVPVSLGGHEAAGGLIFDTRTFPSLKKLPPAQPGDSGVKGMQHMAVVRDFRIFATQSEK
ncbi:MAG: endonuclease/exonuclease/phosphatase family protein [Chthoniobacterales bacterium]